MTIGFIKQGTRCRTEYVLKDSGRCIMVSKGGAINVQKENSELQPVH